VQEAQYFIRVRHVAEPCIPCCVGEAVAEPSHHENNNEDGVGRVHCDYDIGD
jgi:hypothetical protein